MEAIDKQAAYSFSVEGSFKNGIQVQAAMNLSRNMKEIRNLCANF